MKFSLTLLSLLGSLAVCHADAVRLQIKGPDGKPVVGAQVRVFNVGQRLPNSAVMPSRDVKSDAAGMVILNPQIAANLPKTSGQIYYVARVIAPGMAVAQVGLKEGNNSVTLNKGQSFGGVILDAEDKPIAGVKVGINQLSSVRPSLAGVGTYSAMYLRDVETRSDAQGRWKLDNVPLTGSVGFRVSDTRFRSEFFWLDVSHTAPPFYMDEGATVKGRLLLPDGKPAAGIEFSSNTSNPSIKTRTDGTFQFTGLGRMFYSQRVIPTATNSSVKGQPPLIIPSVDADDLESGEVRDLGDIKTRKGIRYRGKVVDSVTNKPIADAWVSAWKYGRTNTNGQTDAQGVFDFFIAPDCNTTSISGAGYMQQKSRPQLNITAAHIRNGLVNIGIVKLVQGRKAEGTVKTADGKGIQAQISARRTKGSSGYGMSDAQGKFVLDGLEEGEYTVAVQGYKLKAPVKFTVGKGATAPLRLVLRENAKPKTPNVVRGRILYEGKPMAGAKIRFNFRSERSWYIDQMAVSNQEGEYRIDMPMENSTPDIIGVARPGYSAEYRAPLIQDGVWRGDVVLRKQGILHGRVVDSAQQPVANVSVAPEKGLELPVSTNANGEFTLKDVPAAGVTLFASDGGRWKSYKVEKEGEVIQIVLPDAVPIASKAALAEMVVPNSTLDWEWGKNWQVRGQLLGEMLVRARAAGSGYWDWKEMMHIQAERAPEKFLEHEEENRDRAPSNNRAEFERLVMLARAGTKDKENREVVKAWLTEQEKERREISPGSVSLLLEMGEIAQRIDPKQGLMWSEYAAQLADQISSGDSTWQWGKLAARVSPRAVDVLTAECKAEVKLQYLSSAIAAYTERGDSASARQIFARMEKLLTQVQATYKPKGKQVPRQVQMAKFALAEAREQLTQTLAFTDPAAAIQNAVQLPDHQRVPLLISIARNAVAANKMDVARKAINLVDIKKWRNSEFGAQVAAVTMQFDKEQAESLFLDAFRKLNPKSQDTSPWRMMARSEFDETMYYSIAPYAKARAKFRPGESRVLIEREWVKRQEGTKKKEFSNYSNQKNMQELVSAMAEIDPQRAIEMQKGLSNNYGFQARARGDIALALLRGN